MAKVHITLVGGQAMPVYQGIRYTKPDRVIAICSKESKRRLNPIREILINKIPLDVLIFDPIDLHKIKESAQNCLENLKDDDVTINISGGTKPWTYYFVELAARYPNVSLLYVDQNSKIWDFGTETGHQVTVGTEIQLRLQGARLTKYKKFQIRSSSHGSELKSLVTSMSSPDSMTARNRKGAKLKWEDTEKSFYLSLSNGDNHELCSPNVRSLLLMNGWFDVKTAKLLSEWGKCTDILLNCKFDLAHANENEIDIIANVGNKLLFVECKSGGYNGTDIDKFYSAVKKLGGNSSKAMFASYEKINQTNMNKCEKYGIIPYSYTDSKSNKLNESSLKTLFRRLEREIIKTNL